MKIFIKYSLTSILSLIIGTYIGWQVFWHQVESRVVPFDRSQYDNLLMEPYIHEPWINFEIDGTTQMFWTSKQAQRKSIDNDLDEYLKRIAGYNFKPQISICFNPQASIDDISRIKVMIHDSGISKIKVLIEENRKFKEIDGKRMFKELKIGQRNSYYWHIKEWFIENEQLEANKTIEKAQQGCYSETTWTLR